MYKRLLPVILLLLSAMYVQARTTVDLYLADIPVSSESKRLSDADARRALAQVLIRITGNPDILRREEVIEALKQAGRMVFRFRFHREQSAEGEVQTRVEVGFDPAGVQKLVRTLSLPWWNENRPELLWVVVHNRQGVRQLVNEESLPALMEGSRTARERGLPLTLPLLDLLDRQHLSAVELWGGFTDGLEPVASRYGADGWLLLRLEPLSGAWKARWQLRLPGKPRHAQRQWQRIDADLGALLSHGMDRAAALLAETEAIPLSEAGSGLVWIEVDGLHSLANWLELESWLLRQPWVEQLELRALHAGKTRLEIHITTDVHTMEQALAASGLLEAVAEDPPGRRWLWARP